MKYFIAGIGSAMEPAEPKPPSRALGWLLALPLGLVIASVIFLLLVANGHYFFGEFVVIFFAVFAAVFFVRLQYRQSRRNYWRARLQANAPARILRQRYARGEISREQFQQMMRDLREDRQPPAEPTNA
ncbi:MAG TPA: SHOCT domain-containing protein [Nitrososphaerales archaeon]|nr:SHOCT domain-containing protein [Nitrososphaerales archaeon]